MDPKDDFLERPDSFSVKVKAKGSKASSKIKKIATKENISASKMFLFSFFSKFAHARRLFRRSTRYFLHYAVISIFILVLAVGLFTRPPKEGKIKGNPYVSSLSNDQVNEVTYVQSVATIAVLIDEDLGKQVYEVSAKKANMPTIAMAGSGFVSSSNPAESVPSEDKPKNEVKEYMVQDGDTLSTIAAKFDLTSDSLRWANGIEDADSVKPGQKLMIPPTVGVLHLVAEGETIESIANKYSSTADTIIAQNDLYGENVKVGMRIMIPDGVGPEAKKPEPVPEPEAPKTKIASASGGKYGSSSYIGRTGSFRFPTVANNYYNGYHRDAIDIEGYMGAPIYAADSGQIAEARYGYSGGYGNTILINHGDGFSTRYAHMTSLLITGGYVSKGQVIGYMGSTGRSSGVHLHFEIMIGGAKQNPMRYF